MKKYIYVFLMVLLMWSTSAIDTSCFQQISKINNPWSQTIKFSTYSSNIYPYQDKKILNYKIYDWDHIKNVWDYEIVWLSSNSQNIWSTNLQYLWDNTFEFDQYDTDKYIIIKPKHRLIKDSFEIYIDYEWWNIEYQISKDGKTRSSINNEIYKYDIDYLKIKFPSQKDKISNTKINQMLIYENNFKQYVINSTSNSEIYIYSNYNCKDKNLQKEINNLNRTDRFAIDTNTKSFESDWKNNPSYNKSLDSDMYANDSDQDGIKNPNDNCPYIYNSDQRDIDANMKWDLCSDDDNDNIVWYLDNCIYISNPDQRDINNNNIGDACEFDKDKDSIFDSIDNCINKANPDQLDTDGDKIGDICDNCYIYNPEQKIVSGNTLWDVCIDGQKSAEKQKKYEDKDQDGIIDPADNCPLVANKNQLDIDNDNMWDLCDNCKNIKNENQKDDNKNWTGDICEDIDKDWIVGYIDNCPNIYNPDQKDDNNNNMGNVCEDDDNDSIINAIDNCPNNYNYDQKDVDNDKIGDACDTKDDRFIESNRPFFVGIALGFIWIFGSIIYMMIRKLNRNWQK